MALKKKQRPATIEELKYQIKHEKEAQWMHSTPLFGLVKNQNGVYFLPVEKVITEQLLLLFIADPTDYSGDRIFEFIEILNSRYHGIPWLSTVIFDIKYTFAKNHTFWDHYKQTPTFNKVPVYQDTAGEFSEWAQAKKFPKALIYYKGEPVKEFTLDQNTADAFLQIETQLQELFRMNDPGLPLPLLYEYETHSPIDRIKPLNTEITFKGHWTPGGDTSAMTEDNNAMISIPFEGKSFRLIASLPSQAQEGSALVLITFNGKPITSANLTEAIITDNHGVTSFEISRFQGIYDLFTSQETVKGVIELHFKNAANSPTIYWGSKIG